MKKNFSTYFWGVALIILGIGFLMENFGSFNFKDIIGNYWPILFVIVGVGELMSGKWTSAIFWLVLGAILQLNELGYINFDVWELIGPFILIFIGARIMFRQAQPKNSSSDSDDYVSATAIFGGSEKKINSKSFKGANINAIFGGATIDLRNAEISSSGADIETLVLFGGADIIAPNNMSVKMETVSIFGGSEDERTIEKSSDKKPFLRVKGTVLFGGLTIKDKE